MNANLSNQERKLIFDAYSNCGVHHPADRAPFRYMGVKMLKEDMNPMRPVLYGDWSGGTNPDLACESHVEWKHIKLILRRFAKMTDEHAELLGRLLLRGHKNVADEFNYALHGRLFCTNRYRQVYFDVVIPALDLLRKLGYDCGYGDIPSLIDAEIAIEEA